jgi:hypothetical protein
VGEGVSQQAQESVSTVRLTQETDAAARADLLAQFSGSAEIQSCSVSSKWKSAELWREARVDQTGKED